MAVLYILNITLNHNFTELFSAQATYQNKVAGCYKKRVARSKRNESMTHRLPSITVEKPKMQKGHNTTFDQKRDMARHKHKNQILHTTRHPRKHVSSQSHGCAD